MRSRTIDLDGPVHYADFGGTGPTLVLVHGLGGSHVNWLAVAPVLARRARVLAVDLAGFGRTPLGERSADVHANRILLDRFLEAVAAGPVVLVGNSMGGLVAMMEAALAPERVAGLVLVAPAQPRSAEARMDGRVAALFLYALPVLGELALRWRARLLGPAGQVRSTLALCCADASRVAPEVVAAHVALARERLERMPWASRAFMEAARSLIASSRGGPGSTRWCSGSRPRRCSSRATGIAWSHPRRRAGSRSCAPTGPSSSSRTSATSRSSKSPRASSEASSGGSPHVRPRRPAGDRAGARRCRLPEARRYARSTGCRAAGFTGS